MENINLWINESKRQHQEMLHEAKLSQLYKQLPSARAGRGSLIVARMAAYLGKALIQAGTALQRSAKLQLQSEN